MDQSPSHSNHGPPSATSGFDDMDPLLRFLNPTPMQSQTGAPPVMASPQMQPQAMQRPGFGQNFRQNLGPLLMAIGTDIASGGRGRGLAMLPGMINERQRQQLYMQEQQQEQQSRNATAAWLRQRDPDLAQLVEQGSLDSKSAVAAWYDKQRIANMPQDNYIAAGAGRIFDKATGTYVKDPMMEGSSSHDPAAITQQPASPGLPASPPGITGKPLTEGQDKSVVYSTRARGALEKFEPIADELTGLRGAVAGNIPVVGNYLKPDKYQAAEQAGQEFLQAILRKDTGAAITSEEQELYGKTFLPQPGDGPDVLHAKKLARARALVAMEAGMPANAVLAQGQALQGLGGAQQQQQAPAGPPMRYRYNPATGDLEPVQ